MHTEKHQFMADGSVRILFEFCPELPDHTEAFNRRFRALVDGPHHIRIELDEDKATAKVAVILAPGEEEPQFLPGNLPAGITKEDLQREAHEAVASRVQNPTGPIRSLVSEGKGSPQEALRPSRPA